MSEHEFVVIGSGMGGLTAGSLLARSGRSVCVLEAHEYPGGCAHTFPMGPYRFCAAVHYIFFCGEGEPVHNFLRKLGLEREIEFLRLDPEGYDRFTCPSAGVSFRIPSDLGKWRDRMCDRFPACSAGIRRFFTVIERVVRELHELPAELSLAQRLSAPFRFPTVLKYRSWTLQRLFDALDLPPEAQAVLATQVGDLGLPPDAVSLVIYAALIHAYGAGAYYPEKHFGHFIETLARVISDAPGSRVEYGAEVVRVHVRSGRVVSVETADGRRFSGRVFICNMDPRRFIELAGREHFPRRFLEKVDYRYSTSAFAVYLGVRGLDLRAFGFGNWNRWHYPHLDINRAYSDQLERAELGDPWMFMSTPSLCSAVSSTCPAGEQILELVTVAPFARFEELKTADRRAYYSLKRSIADRMIDIVERSYVPRLREHVVMRVIGTPATHHRYLWAPAGNIYGSELTPKNIDLDRLKFRSPIGNLFFTGASAEFPSIGATVLGGSRLYAHLTGDAVNPGRDPRRLF
jgi:phytoene dehydrogenase-like protein